MTIKADDTGWPAIAQAPTPLPPPQPILDPGQVGKLTDFTNYSVEMDFAFTGRPSFMDVWGEQTEVPFFGTGRRGRMVGWGAWELAARWSWVDLSGVNVRPGNIVQPSPPGTLPLSPNAGVLNETTVGVNWWWNRFTRVQFNWIHSMPDYINYGLAPFDIYGTRFQVEF